MYRHVSYFPVHHIHVHIMYPMGFLVSTLHLSANIIYEPLTRKKNADDKPVHIYL